MDSAADHVADDLHCLSFDSGATLDQENRSASSGSGGDVTTWTATGAASSKRHAPSGDPRWEAVVERMRKEEGTSLGIGDLRFLYRLGSGDIGSVYLVELRTGEGGRSSSSSEGGVGGCVFAAKVMDKRELVSRNKESRAKVEREILEVLDHPFLPRLYATLECPRWCCLLTEFCPGGDLHVLRQRQPERRFGDPAVRFYASEVIVALEYLHMMGIIYRDLKPENVLVRSDGHIMLTDFDLSLKSDYLSSTAQIVSQCQQDQRPHGVVPSDDLDRSGHERGGSPHDDSCIIPNCIVPKDVPCFYPSEKRQARRRKKKRPGLCGALDIVAEPLSVRSMSFVGTHEYLAPEIVSGEGHGNAVDWWTLGVFVYEMFYGVTPFKGVENELTLANIVARALEFPKEPSVPSSAKDLIAQLLIKDPSRRMGSTTGAAAIKRHDFFNGVNWALLRCVRPPYVPRSVNHRGLVKASDNNSVDYY
ncbi:hypothetical protein MLD38_003759 [Melastoma candidum]|uniref:Uncharacterized protein n=1 Tax=Melastoma candidum TaxID=119954 RepID=A0ACB9S5J4_9MYRT|nr:hypothetical protein MLD38_003759 [Melastoma candidum]